MKTVHSFSLSFFLLLLLGIGGTFQCHPKKEQATDSARFTLSPVLRKRLKVTIAKEEKVQGQLVLNGKVSAFEDKMVKVSPLVDGVIESLYANLGDFVQKGQTLAIIKSSEVSDAENQVTNAEATLRNNEKNLSVTKDMARLGLAAEKDIVLAKNEVDRAKGEVKRAREVTSLYEMKNSFYTMKAPITGYIVDKNLTLSAHLAYDNSQVGPFYTIADLTKMQVVADVYEADIANIQEGEPVQLKVLALPNERFKGKIERIQYMIDPQTRTMKVRISVPNPQLKLKPEMFAQVIVEVEENKRMVAVPTDALVFDNNRYHAVLYHSPSNIEVRTVHPFLQAKGMTYVKSGLRPGDRLIVSDPLIVYNALTNNP